MEFRFIFFFYIFNNFVTQNGAPYLLLLFICLCSCRRHRRRVISPSLFNIVVDDLLNSDKKVAKRETGYFVSFLQHDGIIPSPRNELKFHRKNRTNSYPCGDGRGTRCTQGRGGRHGAGEGGLAGGGDDGVVQLAERCPGRERTHGIIAARNPERGYYINRVFNETPLLRGQSKPVL